MNRFVSLLLLLLLAGCSGGLIYRIDIQQGNVVTQDMVAKLKPGMSRSQVRFALGTPMIADMFHADRWDYVYLLERDGRRTDERRLTVLFEGDKLLRVVQETPLPEAPVIKAPAVAASTTPAETAPAKAQ